MSEYRGDPGYKTAHAMPERVLTPDTFNRLLGFYRSGRGGEYDAAADTLNAHDTALRAALLAAEARVREVEAERDALKEELDNGGAGQVSVVWVGGDEWHDEWCAWYKPEEWPLGSHRAASAFIAQKVATLRAEHDALVPLARLGLGGLDGGSYYLDYLVRLGVSKPTGKETPATTQARAILAREER